MKDCDYTLELSDGTIVQVAATNDSCHPDVKAFHFPPGALVPFSHQNLPTARSREERSDRSFTPAY